MAALVQGRTVLHVTECSSGGTLRAAEGFARSLPEYEHVLYSPLRAEEVSTAFVRAHTMPDGLVGRIAGLRRLVAHEVPDVVHAHSSWAGVYSRVRRLPRPVVYQPHCYAFDDPATPRAVRAAYRLIERALATNSDGVVVLTPHEADLATSLASRRVTVVPNVPTVPVLPEQPVIATTTDPVVVMAGRLCPQKDPGFFADVAAQVHRTRPGIRFVWIGDGEPSLAVRLRRAGVTVTGWLPDTELARTLAGANLYLHTGLYEGFPLSVLDAAATRLPVLVRDIPAFRGSGLEHVGSVPAAATATVRLLGDPDELARARARGSRLLEAMNLDEQRRSLTELYRAVSDRDHQPADEHSSKGAA
jgi:glycosyltransferase involved in cell wall biosynthesis